MTTTEIILMIIILLLLITLLILFTIYPDKPHRFKKGDKLKPLEESKDKYVKIYYINEEYKTYICKYPSLNTKGFSKFVFIPFSKAIEYEENNNL